MYRQGLNFNLRQLVRGMPINLHFQRNAGIEIENNEFEGFECNPETLRRK